MRAWSRPGQGLRRHSPLGSRMGLNLGYSRPQHGLWRFAAMPTCRDFLSTHATHNADACGGIGSYAAAKHACVGINVCRFLVSDKRVKDFTDQSCVIAISSCVYVRSVVLCTVLLPVVVICALPVGCCFLNCDTPTYPLFGLNLFDRHA